MGENAERLSVRSDAVIPWDGSGAVSSGGLRGVVFRWG